METNQPLHTFLYIPSPGRFKDQEGTRKPFWGFFRGGSGGGLPVASEVVGTLGPLSFS